MKKMLVIDGNSILNRAFYGIRLLTNQEGLYTNAVYGMVTILSRHLEQLKPDYCAVAFGRNRELRKFPDACHWLHSLQEFFRMAEFRLFPKFRYQFQDCLHNQYRIE